MSRSDVSASFGCVGRWTHKWEFSKISGTVFWGPYNKDPPI